MGKVVLYYHAGAGNHGCEAIVRATKKILQRDMILYSVCPEEDLRYGLDDLVEVREDKQLPVSRKSIKYLAAAVSHYIRHDDFQFISYMHEPFFASAEKGDVYLSIGGDNYCYQGRDILGYYNERLHQKGVKTVLWGCSFEPSDMTPAIAEDLSRYDLIVAREGISYEALKAVNSHTVLLPDPAFQLDREDLPLPEGFKDRHTIGINVSPLAADCGTGSLVMDNYRELIGWLIENTEEQILLVPHVVKPDNNDRTTLGQLYEEFADTSRVIMLEDYNCMQLKGYIARCRMFLGARTHATIAAYSTCVPTLVAGYSVKAKGIAQELFGTDENYVLPVQQFSTAHELTAAFCWLMEHEEEVRQHLERIMPEYKARTLTVRDIILNL